MNIEPLDTVRRFAFFQEGCSTLVGNACRLLSLAGEPVTINGVILIVKTVPLDIEQLTDQHWKSGFCNLSMKKAYDRCVGTELEPRCREVFDYFINLPARHVDAVEMAEAGVLGVLTGMVWDAVREEPAPPQITRRSTLSGWKGRWRLPWVKRAVRL